jgi:glutamine amidotransferase
MPNPDGWGIALYADGSVAPRIERRSTAAFADLRFSEVAARACAHTVVAHVRRASVGAPGLENTHPFAYGRWTFAHNGTVTCFESIAPRMAAETAPGLLRGRRGTTDSELFFLWLLSRLARGGIDPDGPCGDLPRLADRAGAAVAELAALCEREGAATPATLNCLLTDGEVLLAVSWNAPLYWTAREGPQRCEHCGTSHLRPADEPRYQAVAVASEPICHGAWQPLPARSILAADGGARATLRSL